LKGTLMKKSRIKKRWVILIILALVLTVPYVLAGREDKSLNEAARKSAGGGFMKLPGGFTHYELSGTETGRPVVLVHGLSVPMFDWDQQVEPLKSAGFRVLRYDHYGRGFSDRPHVTYDRRLYGDQLLHLLDGLNLKRPVDLVAHSFGGAVAVEFAVRHPERVRRLVLLAPVFHVAEGNTGVKLVRVPLLGDYMARLVLARSLGKRAGKIFRESNVPDPQRFNRQFREQTTYRGFLRSVISMFRSNALDSYEGTYREVGKQNRKIMLVWGNEDKSVSRAKINRIKELIPGVEFHLLEGIGHSPNLQVPKKFNDLTIRFLKG